MRYIIHISVYSCDYLYLSKIVLLSIINYFEKINHVTFIYNSLINIFKILTYRIPNNDIFFQDNKVNLSREQYFYKYNSIISIIHLTNNEVLIFSFEIKFLFIVISGQHN